MSSRIKRRGAFMLLAALVLTLGTVMPAQASTRVECVAAGFTDHTLNPDGTVSWHIVGQGECVDTLQGPWLVNLVGNGTSDNLGLCTSNLLMSNLNLSVHINSLNLRTLNPTPYDETWSAPLSVFPIATPFFISSGTGSPGLGVILTRILANCPPGGLHTATYAWSQVFRSR